MNKLKLLLKQIRALFPSKLPVGVSEFEVWADSLQELYTLPTQDKDSIRFTLASIIMHLGPQAGHKSKYFFYVTLLAGASKQVANSVFYDIKKKHQDAANEASKQAV